MPSGSERWYGTIPVAPPETRPEHSAVVAERRSRGEGEGAAGAQQQLTSVFDMVQVHDAGDTVRPLTRRYQHLDNGSTAVALQLSGGRQL